MPRHVGVIMDGNGRWARARRLPREAGHRAGADAVDRTVTAARELGVPILTLYAFSSDNWKRPRAEVRHLMSLLRRYLDSQLQRAVDNGVRVSVIGRRDRLDPKVRESIVRAETATASVSGLHLRIAIDYSARQSIVEAARRLRSADDVAEAGLDDGGAQAAFAHALGEATGQPVPSPDVDLLIRTSGERRLSDFLLWECAYAELHFTEAHWPDFGRDDLEAALDDFARRERRYGDVAAREDRGAREDPAARRRAGGRGAGR